MVSILSHNEFNFSGMQRCHASSNYVCHQRCQRASKRPPSRSTLSQQAVCHASVWRAVEYVLNVRHNLSNWLSLSPHVSVPGSVGWLWPTRWTIYKSLNKQSVSPLSFPLHCMTICSEHSWNILFLQFNKAFSKYTRCDHKVPGLSI